MKLLIIICFYIANFSFFIKSDCSYIKDFNPYISCDNEKYYYYDTISCSCVKCDSEFINGNNCYSENPKSLYFNKDLQFPNNKCSKNESLTELDDTGKWLGTMRCEKTSIEETYETEINFNNIFSFSNENKVLRIYDENNFNINYYYKSCKEGYYEQSCQHLANLCVMSIYSNQEICNSLSVLSENLKRSGIVDSNL